MRAAPPYRWLYPLLLVVGFLFGCASPSGPSEDASTMGDMGDLGLGQTTDAETQPDEATAVIADAIDGGRAQIVPAGECTTNDDCVVSEGFELGTCEALACDVVAGLCRVVSIEDQSPCDDQNECTSSSTCSGGLCVVAGNEAWIDCLDGNPCTSDGCDPGTGCVYDPISSGPCDDGEECTANDYCKEGQCLPGTDICPAQCGNDKCQDDKGETCETCVEDCGPCTQGCEPLDQPGCNDCPCGPCVCAVKPACCAESWTSVCVSLCEAECGGCP